MAEKQDADDNYRAARMARAVSQVYPRLAAFPVYQALRGGGQTGTLTALGTITVAEHLDSPPRVSEPRSEARTYQELQQEQRWADMLNCYFQVEARLKSFRETPYHTGPQEALQIRFYELRKANSAIYVMEDKLEVFEGNMTTDDEALAKLIRFCRGVLAYLHAEVITIAKACKKLHDLWGMKWY